MVPGSGEDKIVQGNEILVIAGQQHRGMTDRLGEVVGIRRPRVAVIRREHHRMAYPVQLADHAPVGELIDQIEPHAPDTPSAGTLRAQGQVHFAG